MRSNFFKSKGLLLVASSILLTTACSSEDSTSMGDNNSSAASTKDFQLAFANGSGAQSGTLLQGVNNLTEGVISFSDKGFQMPSSRTARIFTSSDRKYVYNLNYTVGDIQKFEYLGGQAYRKIGEVDSSVPLGTKRGRFTKIDDKIGSVHYVNATPIFSGQDNTVYEGHKNVGSIAILDLETMSFKPGVNKAIDINLGEDYRKKGYYLTRIDAPVLSNNKLYYGTAVSIYDPSTGKSTPTDKAFTLVVDYNNLGNVSVLTTDHVVGSTNGYRTPAIHKNEKGEILQMVNGKDKTYIAKIVDGKYDTSFKFDLGEALGGKRTSSNGWFYVGNGIGYMPYEKRDEDKVQIGNDKDGIPTYSAAWGLARIDLNNNTVVNLDVPAGLWLTQYQTSVVRDGVFYIALAPVSGKGNIYMYDVNSTSPTGKRGAEVTSGVDQYYIGIY